MIENVAAAGGAIYLTEGARLVRRHAIGPGYPETAAGARPDERAWRIAPWGGELPSLLVLPLNRDGGQPMGLIAVHAAAGRTFSPQDQELGLILTSFGCQAIRVFQALENLRWSEERLRRTIENSPSAISLRDLGGRFVVVNRQFEAWHGVAGAGVAGRNVAAPGLYRMLPPHLVQRSAKFLGVFLALAVVTAAVFLLAYRLIDLDTGIAQADNARLLLRVYLAALVLIAIGAWWIVLSHESRELAERELVASLEMLTETRQELMQQERLATIGQLTATVSHELRNPLGTLTSSVALLRKYADGTDDRVGAELDRLQRNIWRCVHIIEDLLDFSRDRQIRLQPVRMDAIDDREITVINVFVGGLTLLVSLFLAFGPGADAASIQAASYTLLFTFTYLWVAWNRWNGADGRGLGWFCFFVGVTVVPIFLVALGGATTFWDYWFAICWGSWAVLWLLFWVLLALQKTELARFTGGLCALQGIYTGWIPGFMLLNGWIGPLAQSPPPA